MSSLGEKYGKAKNDLAFREIYPNHRILTIKKSVVIRFNIPKGENYDSQRIRDKSQVN